MTIAFACAKASFLPGVGAGFAKQNRCLSGGESHKTASEFFSDYHLSQNEILSILPRMIILPPKKLQRQREEPIIFMTPSQRRTDIRSSLYVIIPRQPQSSILPLPVTDATEEMPTSFFSFSFRFSPSLLVVETLFTFFVKLSMNKNHPPEIVFIKNTMR